MTNGARWWTGEASRLGRRDVVRLMGEALGTKLSSADLADRQERCRLLAWDAAWPVAFLPRTVRS